MAFEFLNEIQCDSSVIRGLDSGWLAVPWLVSSNGFLFRESTICRSSRGIRTRDLCGLLIVAGSRISTLLSHERYGALGYLYYILYLGWA